MSGIQFSNNGWPYANSNNNNRPANATNKTAYLDATSTAQAPVVEPPQTSLNVAFSLLRFAMDSHMQSPAEAGFIETAPSASIYSNDHIQLRANQLLGNNPALQQLFYQAANLDPQSPQAQQIAQLLVQGMQQTGYSTRDIREVLILQAGLGINNIIGSLNQIAANLEPAGPEAQEIQVRLSSLQDIKSQLQQQLSQLNQSSGFSTRDIKPASLPQTDFSAVKQIATLLQVASNLEPDGPEAQQIQARINALQSQLL